MADFVKLSIFGTEFEITTRYTDLQPVGMGAFGLVCSARDQLKTRSVAIKKIMRPFSASVLAKRTYRELKLLKDLQHENIISMSDVFVSPKEDIYFVTELLGTDLYRLRQSRPLEKQFIQYFLYQILRGLKYVHSAGVIHRDLKPSNIVINENCDLRICDFGLARIQDPQMTGYVSTRYYRAPEIMLTWQKYDVAVDIWSAGCILAEMFEGTPLFPGKDHVHQFSIITELLGTPPDDVIQTIGSENTLRFVQSLPRREPVSFKTRFPDIEPLAVDLLEKMLVFDPRKRITASEALAHPYLETYHDEADEPEAAKKFDWSFNDADLPVEEWKVMMYNEILDFLHVFDGDAPEDESQAATESNIDPLSAASSTDTQATANSTEESSKATVDRIIQLENSVVSSQQNLNDLVDILSIAKSGNVETTFVATNSLGRIFAALWKQGLLKRQKEKTPAAAAASTAVVSEWLRSNYNEYLGVLKAQLKHSEAAIQVGALKLLMQAVSHEGENASQSTGSYEFPNSLYLNILELVLDSTEASDQLLRSLADSYLNLYDDLRYYFFRDVAKIASPDYDPFKTGGRSGARTKSLVEETESFVSNTFAVMGMVRVVPTAKEYTAFWVNSVAPSGDYSSVSNAAAHRKAFSEAWIAFLRQPLSAEIYKQVLLSMHRRIIPHMVDATGLMDFLSTAYDSGGSISLLALNGLFTLISEYNLNYPQFYEKLYALFDRNLLHVKYRARFFRLFELFLGSSHLPAYLVAAFIKRMARLAVSATPSGAVTVIPVIYNLLKAHPSCMVLIHRMPGGYEDGGEESVSAENDMYLANEADPAKCNALSSSLWELETLQHHYYPNIATLANIFGEPFHKPKFLLEDFLDHTYATFFDGDTVRTPKKAPALAVQPPVALLRTGDAISDFLVL
ncbi:MAPK protein hog1 [Coemansia sp. RSA 1694]|nr:MAPK protein hog1 [Coemansia sp. RSA 1694]